MKNILRYTFRTVLILILLTGILITFLLNPQLVYAQKHEYRQFKVYSKLAYPEEYNKIIDQALQLVQKSSIYNKDMKLDIFLNDGDGASVKFILKKILGNAFAWGYHNNVILNGTTDSLLQSVELNGQSRHMARLLAHEMIHCYQLKKLGLFKSKPLADIPIWKWEGYAEYIAFHSGSLSEESIILNAFKKYEEEKDTDSLKKITVVIDGEESFTGKDYYRFWLLVKYLSDINKYSFEDIIKTNLREDDVYNEMKQWYKSQPPVFSPPSGP